MSKKAKSAAKDKRKALKRGRKAAQKLQYATWAANGQNTSKRSKLRNKRNAKHTLNATKHSTGPCGNWGCKKCCPGDHNLYTPRQIAANNRKK
jgi:hypothetical protein